MDKDRRAYLTEYQRNTLRKKKKRVELLLDPKQVKALDGAAGNKKLGPFILSAALAYIEGEYIIPDEDRIRSLELQLRRIGTNINQIAKKANREGVDADSIAAAANLLPELERALSQIFRNPEKR